MKPNTLLELAQTQHQAGQLQEALNNYQLFLKENPTQPDVYHCVGVILSQLKRYEEAIVYFEEAITKDPTEASFYNSKGNALAQIGKLKEAKACYEEAIRLNPRYIIAYNNLGNCLYRQKKIQDALRAYQKALVLFPSSATVHFNYGRLKVETEAIEEGIRHLKKAISLDPTHLSALSQLAHIYLHQGNYEQAIELYQKRLSVQPNHAPTLHQLGVCYLKSEQYLPAITYLEQALLNKTSETDTHYCLATAYLQTGDHKKALTHYLRQLEEQPSVECLYNIGVLHMYQERQQDAIDYFMEVLKNCPTHIESHINLGAIYLKRKDLKKAELHYEAALKLDPANPEIKHILLALKQNEVPLYPPETYIKNLFDQYAPHYDQHLTKFLHYQVPQKLLSAILPYVSSDTKWKILDLGCGTGLCGGLFKSLASELIGVDLSKKMLDQAQQKDCYTQLICTSIEKALELYKAQKFDLVLAADVLPYIGDLSILFEKIKKVLREGGYFLFTVEHSSKAPYTLQPTIRYAHSVAYLQQLSETQGFKILKCENLALRLDYKKEVLGDLILLQTN